MCSGCGSLGWVGFAHRAEMSFGFFLRLTRECLSDASKDEKGKHALEQTLSGSPMAIMREDNRPRRLSACTYACRTEYKELLPCIRPARISLYGMTGVAYSLDDVT